MTILELDNSQDLKDKRTDLLKKLSEETETSAENASNTPSGPSTVFPFRSAPKIEKVEKSKVLERAAAFLPQLASSNRKLSSLPAEEINIEALKGTEERIIEMKLGLGIFEERRQSEEDENRIAVLPSELSKAKTRMGDSERLDAFIQQLLAFNDSEDEPVELFSDYSITDSDSVSESELLEFE